MDLHSLGLSSAGCNLTNDSTAVRSCSAGDIGVGAWELELDDDVGCPIGCAVDGVHVRCPYGFAL